MISYGINSPSVQRTALTLANYFKQHKSVPQEQLLSLYDNRYRENCISSKVQDVSLTNLQSQP
jgi:hypothetical protein